LKQRNDRACERRQQAAPGQDRRDLVRDTGELRRQILDRCAHINEVGQARARGPRRDVAKTGHAGIEPQEQAVRRPTGQDVRETAVTRTEIDEHPAAEGGAGARELLIRALETLAAHDVHVGHDRMGLAAVESAYPSRDG
jgi:hypothetical protein